MGQLPQGFGPQQNLMQMIRVRQIQDLFAYYPETIVISQTPEKEEFRIALRLHVSQTPLFIKL